MGHLCASSRPTSWPAKARARAARTFFAVGDEKQSIFSFQGAAPAMFDAMRREFAARPLTRAELLFDAVSAEPLVPIRAAGARGRRCVFASEQVWRGVSAGEAKAPPHVAFHAELPGLVEIWAADSARPSPIPSDWRMPLDAASRRDPAVALADRIAGVIGDWLSPAFERARRSTPEPASAAPHQSRRHPDPGALARRPVRGDDAGAASPRASPPPAPIVSR